MNINQAMSEIADALGDLDEDEFDEVSLILEDLVESNRSPAFYDEYIGGPLGDEY